MREHEADRVEQRQAGRRECAVSCEDGDFTDVTSEPVGMPYLVQRPLEGTRESFLHLCFLEADAQLPAEQLGEVARLVATQGRERFTNDLAPSRRAGGTSERREALLDPGEQVPRWRLSGEHVPHHVPRVAVSGVHFRERLVRHPADRCERGPEDRASHLRGSCVVTREHDSREEPSCDSKGFVGECRQVGHQRRQLLEALRGTAHHVGDHGPAIEGLDVCELYRHARLYRTKRATALRSASRTC